jgi:hypothetical protein
MITGPLPGSLAEGVWVRIRSIDGDAISIETDNLNLEVTQQLIKTALDEINAKLATLGQKTKAGSVPVVLASDSDPLGVSFSTGVSANAWTVAKSSALASNLLVKATAGVLRSALPRIDSTAESGTYYLQVLNAASMPSNGAVTHLVAPVKVQHVLGVDDFFPFDLTDAGIAFGTGCVIALSTTEFTLTAAGSYLSTTALFK